MRKLIPLAIVIALTAAACSSSDTTDTAASPAPTASPESAAEQASDWPYQFTVATVGGDSLDTGDYAGQDIVLWFWAPW